MDVAGALGFTAIFPAAIGVVLGFLWLVLTNGGLEFDILDTHERIVARRVGWFAIALVGLASLVWIVAIWMGYAQGAPGV